MHKLACEDDISQEYSIDSAEILKALKEEESKKVFFFYYDLSLWVSLLRLWSWEDE